jgi:endoglucanase
VKSAWIALLALTAALGQTPSIRLDQAGYLPGARKVAMVAASPSAQTFSIRRQADGQTVYSGTLGEAALDSNSGDTLEAADFSGLAEPGRFYIDVPGVGQSYVFEIGSEVYRRAYYLAMRAFYGQRCGTAVDMGPEFPHHHAACHLTGAWHGSSGRQGGRVSAYGWHDAGDYGRYVVNSGISTGTLLWTWEMYGPRIANIALNIPESGNGTPDILNEIRWNLEWMLSMQDDDGGVWPKQTSTYFPGFIMPENDASVSYVVGTGAPSYKSSCAAGDFAAVMAIAARAYRPFDAGFADRSQQAAGRAWEWVSAHPNVTFRNPADVFTGEYGDGNCSDERLWAAAELWRTTGQAAYQAYFLANYTPFTSGLSVPGWGGVGSLGVWTYAMAGRADADAVALASIRQATRNLADQIANRSASNGYRISLSAGDFGWGSNSQAANYSLTLAVANRIVAPDQRYTEAALEHLHYLLGRNTFSTSWVTAVGSKWMLNPHHRPSAADGIAEPWPGMLSGGPDRGRDDSVMQGFAANLPPMKYWIDDAGSYSTNEICLNWNAPLVFALAGALPEPHRPLSLAPPRGRRPGPGGRAE